MIKKIQLAVLALALVAAIEVTRGGGITRA